MKVNEYTFNVLGSLNLKKAEKKKDKNVQLMKRMLRHLNKKHLDL